MLGLSSDRMKRKVIGRTEQIMRNLVHLHELKTHYSNDDQMPG